MGLSVSYNQINNGIDVAALKEVTKQIFKRANAQNSVLANADLSKFNRVSLGTDLYGANVNAATARQIAVTNSGIQINLSDAAVNSLKYLSSEASKSILKAVDGKITIAETKEISEKQVVKSTPSFGQLIENASLDSDKKGSNPFYRAVFVNVEEEEQEDLLSIFA